jgi:hypothetical protein
MDTISNLIIILIPVAIVIGRIVVGARNKRNPPPKPAQPHIPVHFEDDNSYFRNRLPAATPEAKPRVPTPPPKLAALTPESYLPATASSVKPVPGRSVAAAAPSGHKDFTLSLSHLPPLKQAVVMAEILGPPKGME